jgi:Trypsin-co-occurring domain 1
MPTELIKLKDGTLVEVQAPHDDFQQLASRGARLVDATIDGITPLITKVCDRVTAAMEDLVGRADVAQAEVSVSLGFEVSGDLYIARSTADANLTVKLVLERPEGSRGVSS